MVKFSYTILYVKDVEATISFYEKAFGFQRTFISPGNEYGELSTGDTVLSFASVALAKTNLKEGFIEADPARQPFGIEIGFTTDNVEEAYAAAVAAGATPTEEAKLKPHGQTVAYVRDPDGFLIEICTPMV